MRASASLVLAASACTFALAFAVCPGEARADDAVGSIAPPVNPSVAPVAEAAPAEAPAAAPTSVPPPPPPYIAAVPEERDRWYGRQILTVDAIALGTGVVVSYAGSGSGNGGYGTALFLGGYAFGGPIVHLAHGRPLAALGSFALRVVAPTFGALTCYSVARLATGGQDGLTPASGTSTLTAVGATVGYAFAVALDAAFLAHETEKVEAPKAASITFSPTLAPMRGGGMAGLSASF